MQNRKVFYICLGVLVVMLLLAYSNHFTNGFHFDDSHTIVDNVNIRNISNIPQFFTDASMFSNSPTHKGLRPIVTTSLAIDYWIGGGLYPFYFQLTNFLWHVGVCIILFFLYKNIFRRSFSDKWIAFIALFATGWFALHTVMAETINYTISRSDTISTFFIIASLLLYIAFPNQRNKYYYILPALVGVFAKETVLVLLIFLFFYILLFEKELSVKSIFQRKNFKAVLGIIVSLLPILFAVLLLQYYTLSKASESSTANSLPNPYGYYWLTQTYVWFYYFKSFFLPVGLSADTDLGVIKTVFDWRILVGIVFVTLLIITIFKTSAKKETKSIAFGLICFGAALLPTSVAPFAEVMNDHRMYFAYFGLTLSVVSCLWLFLQKRKRSIVSQNNYRLVFVLCFMILALNGFGVFQRNQVWRTEETLWKDVTEKSPLNGRGWMNYGNTLMSKGQYEDALENFKKAKELMPAYSTIYTNMGIVYGELGDKSAAITHFNNAVGLAPNDFSPYAYFSRYLVKTGDHKEAREIAEMALALNPKSLIALNAAMASYEALGMWSPLERTAKLVLSMDPTDNAAAGYLDAAVKKERSSKTTLTVAQYIDLSLTLYNAGDFNGCILACRDALKLDPKNADAYSNMCAAYNSLKEWDKAIDACNKALQINPDHKMAPGNLQWALKKTR